MGRIKTIDAEVAGEAVRLIVGGGPNVPGRTMAEKHQWLQRNRDDLRRLLMLEPRGHMGMHGAIFTEPVSPNAQAGLLTMHAGGFPPVSGEGIIGALTIAIENRLLEGVADEVLIDTPAGLFDALLNLPSIELTGVPSFVHANGLPLHFGSRTITVDIAFGGEFYAIADSEAIGVPIDMANGPALIRVAREITEAVESTVHVQHPVDRRLKGLGGAIFTGASHGAADLRTATVLGGEVLRRSPGVTGTAALMAVLDAMGVLTAGHRFTHEGVLGTVVHGSITRRKQVGELTAIVPVVEGSALITGYHEFVS